MKQTYKIAEEYARALELQSSAETNLGKALRDLGSDNQVISLSEPVTKAYTNLVKDLLGHDLFDWLEWWIYECDHGTKARGFALWQNDGFVEYDVKDLSIYQFLELVDAHY